jgi:hypothetical protein
MIKHTATTRKEIPENTPPPIPRIHAHSGPLFGVGDGAGAEGTDGMDDSVSPVKAESAWMASKMETMVELFE